MGKTYQERVPTRLSTRSPTLKNLEFSVIGDNHQSVVFVEGSFAAGDARRFAEWFSKLPEPQPTIVLLDSPGGILIEGMLLGQMFRKVGLATGVGPGQACYSACSISFLGGVRRFVSTEGQYGVHWASGIRDNDPRKTHSINLVILEALQQYSATMTGSTKYVEAMASAYSSDMRILSNKELQDFNIITY